MEQTPANTKSRSRKVGFAVLAVVVIIGGLIWLARWILISSHYESTDDAYISSDLVQITSEIPGTVLAVRVDDTQSVERGAPLVELDPADAKVAANAAEAELARAVRNARGLFAQRDQLQAQIAQRESD